MPNRLAKETSPYLLQHAHNPVDWYPWGREAFARARAENKPVLLSIGYSACHWCHVMERESFEDDATAQLMNEMFVNVKVDREERPDVDAIYMQAVQAMTGHGGWPMTTFLTPDLIPFWGGTYFPPVDRQGMPSFTRVLQAVTAAYRDKPEDVQRVADSMRQMYALSEDKARSSGTLTSDLLERATRALLAQYDPADGGFGGAPKFPQSMAMEFLLQRWARTGNEAALEAVRESFLAMARGGIHDHVGGGFARYSVDSRWLVPHFEKMLYDNALLLRLGSHLLQADAGHATNREVRSACDGIVRWLAREMTSDAGGFYSALDADSEGHEGKFYVWSESELRALLGNDAQQLLEFWGVTGAGNFEGSNILHVADPRQRRPSWDLLRGVQEILLEARSRRVRPGRDDKILASWNGLMLRAIAEHQLMARGLGGADSTVMDLLMQNAGFLARELARDGRVFRSHKDGESRIPGFLEDYAAIGLAFLAVYELTFDREWLDRARALANAILERFWDDGTNALYDTGAEHDELITRPRDVTDNASPSGTSLAVELLLKISELCGDAEMVRRASFTLETLAAPMAQHPLAFGHALTAADIVVHGAVEVALAGNPSDAGFQRLHGVVGGSFVPSLVLAGGDPTGIPLLDQRDMVGGNATAYVCRGYVCERPTTEPTELFEQLRAAFRP